MGNYVCASCGHWPHPKGPCERTTPKVDEPCGCDRYHPYFDKYCRDPEMPVFCGFPCLDFYDKLAGPDLVCIAPDQGRLEEMVELQGPFCWGCSFEYGQLPKDRVLGRWGLPDRMEEVVKAIEEQEKREEQDA